MSVCPCCGQPVDLKTVLLDEQTNIFKCGEEAIEFRAKEIAYLRVLAERYPLAVGDEEVYKAVFHESQHHIDRNMALRKLAHRINRRIAPHKFSIARVYGKGSKLLIPGTFELVKPHGQTLVKGDFS